MVRLAPFLLMVSVSLTCFSTLFAETTQGNDMATQHETDSAPETADWDRHSSQDQCVDEEDSVCGNLASPKMTTSCLRDLNFDPCIDSSLIDGYCTCNSTTSLITVFRGATSEPDDFYLRYCLDKFAEQSYFRYYGLRIEHFQNLSLDGDILGNMLFDEVWFYGTRIVNVDEIFLAESRNVTKYLIMENIVGSEVPKVQANCLQSLEITFETTENVKLRPANIRHLTSLEELRVSTNTSVQVSRNAFMDLPSLETIIFDSQVDLTFGSLSFALTSNTKTIEIQKLQSATVGSIGVMPGTHIEVHENYAGWSPAIWFNFFLMGGTVQSRSAIYSCSNCQLAWIRRRFLTGGSGLQCFTIRGTALLDWLDVSDFDHCL